MFAVIVRDIGMMSMRKALVDYACIRLTKRSNHRDGRHCGECTRGEMLFYRTLLTAFQQ